MNRLPIYRGMTLLAALAISGCGRENNSLRDALESLPHDTAALALPGEVQVDTGPPESGSAPVLFPEASDTAPWVPEEPTASAEPAPRPGEWTEGAVAAERTDVRMATLGAVRVAQHPEFDRVVLEFSGQELPAYRLDYVDRPVRECGSGDVVRLPGEAWLSIRLTPAQAHDERGRATLRGRVVRPSAGNLLEMRMICDFEGQVEWVLGLRYPSRYRVLELFNPSRLAVDVQH